MHSKSSATWERPIMTSPQT